MAMSKEEAMVVLTAAGVIDIEEMMSYTEDPCGEHTAGRTALVGLALTALGKDLVDEAKDAVSDRALVGVLHEDGVVFKDNPAQTQVRIDTKKVRERYPRDENPDLYVESQRKGSVSVFTEASFQRMEAKRRGPRKPRQETFGRYRVPPQIGG